MIAFTFAINSIQSNLYKPRSPGEIDTGTNTLIIRCDVNDVINTPIRSGTVINKLSGIPIANQRDVRYAFVAEEWEFTAHFSVDILQLISELEVAYPNGIPCKNFLVGKYNAPYTEMLVKFVTIEARGAIVCANGIYVPFNGFTVKIARLDMPT